MLSFERISYDSEQSSSLTGKILGLTYQNMQKVEIISKGGIENREGSIMVDFANMYIGGGCMDMGWVQEEILFLIYPELIFTIMICPPMLDNEAIVMTGAKRYSSYAGYASGTQFKTYEKLSSENGYKDTQPLDERNRIDRTFVGIDATWFGWGVDLEHQFTEPWVFRELSKALIGFKGDQMEPVSETKKEVATGKWGCGVFNGKLISI